MNLNPAQQQILIYAGIAIVVFFFFAVMMVTMVLVGRRLSNRIVGTGTARKDHSSSCGGNCGCQCQPAPQPGCIPALDCAPPFAHPIAIRGLSCDPNNQQFAYAGDIQSFVDSMNHQKEMTRKAESVARLQEAIDFLNGKPAASTGKAAK